MANLSSFFGDPSAGGGSSNQQIGILRMFGTGNGTYTIPASAQYVAYGVVGAGGGSMGMSSTAGCCGSPQSFGGAGGGFSYHEMDISGYSTAITACYTVGLGGCYGRCDCRATNSDGGSTCICGDACLTTICATGGQGACRCVQLCGGSGSGGMVNNCGGGIFALNNRRAGGDTNAQCLFCNNNSANGGGGAGGFIGQGGCGGCKGGGGSGNGGAGGMGSDYTFQSEPTQGGVYNGGSRGVDQLRTGQNLWGDPEGISMICTMCSTVHEGFYQPVEAFHIPGTMLCNTTRYSIGKQIFGAASSSRRDTTCCMGGQFLMSQLPGAGGIGMSGNTNAPNCTRSQGGFLGGGGAGAIQRIGCRGGCGGGGGGTSGCTHPDNNPGGVYSAACCNTVGGHGGDGVAFIEYWLV